MATTSAQAFWNTDLGKTAKAALYIALSAVLSYIITATTNAPELFGVLTPFINIVLVLVKQRFMSPETPNVGAR